MSEIETYLAAGDLAALRQAVEYLEKPTFAIRAANMIGAPIEKLLDRLPEAAQSAIRVAAQRAIEKAFEVARSTLSDSRPIRQSDARHKLACGISGALGGMWGLSALALELPVSTAIMLRSIADIARREGEDLNDPEARFSCVAVFAFGGRPKRDDAAETGYYAVRMALAQGIREAAAAFAGRGFAERQGPMLVRVVAQIAERFGITVSEKAAAQAVPIVGAAGGAAINTAFIDHYQRVAHGHFTVRRLEKKYGAEVVRAEYEQLRLRMPL